MTYRLVFSPVAQTTLAAPIAANSPSLQVVSGAGSLFPALVNNQAFVCTLFKNGNTSIWESVLVTNRVAGSDSLAGLVRNYDPNGVGALSWNAGDIVSIVPTATALNLFLQAIDGQAQTGNYAVDIGSANAYRVNLTPALNGRVLGMPINFLATHTNTGASTFDDGSGAGPAPLIALGGVSLSASNITAGQFHSCFWDGTHFQLRNYRLDFVQLAGAVLNGQVPLSAVQQWQDSLQIAFSQLTGQLQSAQIASNIALPGSPTTTTPAVSDNSTKISTTAFLNQFIQRGTVHVGDVIGPVGGAVTFAHTFTAPPVVTVSLIDANNHGASAVAGVDGIPTTTGFNWAAREIASAVEDAYIHWIAVSP